MWLFGRKKKKNKAGETGNVSETAESQDSHIESAGEQSPARNASAGAESQTEIREKEETRTGVKTEAAGTDVISEEKKKESEAESKEIHQAEMPVSDPAGEKECSEVEKKFSREEQVAVHVTAASDEAEPQQTTDPVSAEAVSSDHSAVPEHADSIEAEIESVQEEERKSGEASHPEEKQPAEEPAGETADGKEKASSVSLYDWGRKKKKKKKKEKHRIIKKTVRLGSGEKAVVLGEGNTKICVPITGRTLEEVVDQSANAAMAFPDLVEWRADYFEKLQSLQVSPESGEPPVNSAASVFPELDFALKKITEALNGIPLLFTLRTASEGGELNLYPEDYIRILLHAAERPEVDAVDVEELRADSDMEVLTREIQKRQKPVIGSAHFFDRMPKKAEQLELLERISRTGADVLKLAAMPSDGRDVLKMMAACEEENRLTEKPVIAIAMGKIGAVSRVSGALTGSCLTFGTVDASSAPGQIPVQTLRTILGALEETGKRS